VKALANCFTKQFETQLHVERHAYSDIHSVNIFREEFTAKHFANATYNLFGCRTNISLDDSRQLRRELRSLVNCFSKQFEVQTGATTSYSPLHIKKHAYSDTAGIRAQQKLSHKLARCQDRVGSWHRQDTGKEETIKPDRRSQDQRNGERKVKFIQSERLGVETSETMENNTGERRSYRIKWETPELSVSPIGRADWERGKRGGSTSRWNRQMLTFMSRERHIEPLFGKPRHRKELDAKTSDMRQPGLEINNRCCSLEETISEQQVVHLALSPAVSTRYSPRFQAPTRSKTCVESLDGPKKTVLSIHPRFHEELPCHRLDGLRMGRGTTVEHDDDTVDRRPVDQENNTYYKDVRVESANASTRVSRQKGRACLQWKQILLYVRTRAAGCA
jgi:hypothetical protein